MLDSGLIRDIAAAALRSAGLDACRHLQPVGGGSIAASFRIDTERSSAFLKVGPATHPFDAEAQALAEIGATGTLRAPRVLAYGEQSGAGFLLLEWIDLHAHGDWSTAGAQLTALHANTQAQYGWHRDNTIGASCQRNTPTPDWAEFFREQRLRPQFALARANGLAKLAALESPACAASETLLSAHRPAPSLLHGDLWRGNFAFDAQDRPVLFDPALYYGDAETDLAMTQLFGGFAQAFYDAYEAVRPAISGSAERRALYQLYHVLNHANLFAGGYVAQAQALIERLARWP